MSYFYGAISGKGANRTTKTGTRNSGLRITAASWSGAIQVELREVNGETLATVTRRSWPADTPLETLWEGALTNEP